MTQGLEKAWVFIKNRAPYSLGGLQKLACETDEGFSKPTKVTGAGGTSDNCVAPLVDWQTHLILSVAQVDRRDDPVLGMRGERVVEGDDPHCLDAADTEKRLTSQALGTRAQRRNAHSIAEQGARVKDLFADGDLSVLAQYRTIHKAISKWLCRIHRVRGVWPQVRASRSCSCSFRSAHHSPRRSLRSSPLPCVWCLQVNNLVGVYTPSVAKQQSMVLKPMPAPRRSLAAQMTPAQTAAAAGASSAGAAPAAAARAGLKRKKHRKRGTGSERCNCPPKIKKDGQPGKTVAHTPISPAACGRVQDILNNGFAQYEPP